jgi:hypothetical protein
MQIFGHPETYAEDFPYLLRMSDGRSYQQGSHSVTRKMILI